MAAPTRSSTAGAWLPVQPRNHQRLPQVRRCMNGIGIFDYIVAVLVMQQMHRAQHAKRLEHRNHRNVARQLVPKPSSGASATKIGMHSFVRHHVAACNEYRRQRAAKPQWQDL